LAATILGTLVIPAVGGHAIDRKAKLHHTNRALRRLHNEIGSSSRAAGDARREIDRLNARLGALQMRINRLSTRVQAARSDVRSIEARIAQTQKRIDAVEHLAVSQAVALYEQGTIGALDVLLDSRSIAQLNERLTLLGVAAKKNTGALVRYGRLEARIEYEHNLLLAKRNQLAHQLNARRNLSHRLHARRSDVRRELARLHESVAHMKDRERGLAARSAAIKRAIRAAALRRSVTSLGTSSEGYIWPLNGAITSPYGPRWGGFHPGIDIDGYTGEPYMTAHSGIVLTAGWIDGYGNAIIVDVGAAFRMSTGTPPRSRSRPARG
jgi:septal ring factor EnvC (AmiA/AmiB activator)